MNKKLTRRPTRRFVRNTLTAGLLVGALATSGCYGRFAATRVLWTWNGDVTNSRFAQTLLFWAMVIIPVYEVFALGDALVINVIEFWSGTNPVDNKSTGPGAAQELEKGKVSVNHGDVRYELAMTDSGSIEVFANGKSVGFAQPTEDGGMALSDTRNGRTMSMTGDQIGKLQAALTPTAQ